MSLSFISIPAVMQAPAPLAAKQWYTVFTRGGAFGIPSALIGAIASGYVASQRMLLSLATYPNPRPNICTNQTKEDRGSLAFKLNVAAALLLPCIGPFTIAFIKPVNDKLIEKMNALSSVSLEDKAVEKGVAKEETTHALIDKWAMLNVVRALFLVAGTLCATVAAVDKRENIAFRGVGLATGADRM